MSRWRICHDSVHYDIVSSNSIHKCSVCGRRWECVIPRGTGDDWLPVYWRQTFWGLLFRGRP